MSTELRHHTIKIFNSIKDNHKLHTTLTQIYMLSVPGIRIKEILLIIIIYTRVCGDHSATLI
jgi:hypothetical protein